MLSVVIIYSEADREPLKNCLSSLPPWAEKVLIETVPGDEWKLKKGIKNEYLKTGTIYYPRGEFRFDHARNRAKKLATKKWILSLDADEYLVQNEWDFLKKIVSETADDIGGYQCTQYSWASGLPKAPGTAGRMAIETIRLFKNCPAIWFEFPIHEVVDNTIRRCGYKIDDCKLSIIHDGYAKPLPEMKEKLWRNIEAIWRHPELKDYERYRNYLIESCVIYKQLGG